MVPCGEDINSQILLGVLSRLKKSKNLKKNSEVGGWVKPQLEFFFILCFFVCFFIHVSIKSWIVGGWGLANPNFSRIFFSIDKIPYTDDNAMWQMINQFALCFTTISSLK